MLATESIAIECPVEKVFKFIADSLAYPRADTKITSAYILSQGEGQMLLSVRSYFLSAYLESSMILKVRFYPFERIELQSELGTISFPARAMIESLAAKYLFEETPVGTLVVYTASYVTKEGFLGRLAERFGQRWLEHHMAETEMPRLKQLVEGLR